MDAKGLAKSKRAHSHSHSHQNSRRHKLSQPQNYPNKQSLLPSNWDRYSDSTPSLADQNPRLRGADYRHLIAEAEAQSQSQLDDVVPDEFSCGVSSMLSVRGDGILAWLADDNFMVDHKNTTSWNPEPSFLSLNLHLLADQLEKLDLCDRLFLQPDLLPPDLLPEDGEAQPSHCSVEVKVAPELDTLLGELDVSTEFAPVKTDVRVAPDKLEAELDTLLGELDVSTEFAPVKTGVRVAPDKLEAELDTLLGELDISTEFRPVKTDVRVPLNNASLDDELDDLLKQTAIPGESSSNPKLLNDFDSWLDTL